MKVHHEPQTALPRFDPDIFIRARLIFTIGRQIDSFFLLCVMVAGMYGGWSVKRSILVVQAVPALIALAAVLLS